MRTPFAKEKTDRGRAGVKGQDNRTMPSPKGRHLAFAQITQAAAAIGTREAEIVGALGTTGTRP
jgi:hypothetical protein